VDGGDEPDEPDYELGQRCVGRHAWCDGDAVIDCDDGKWTRRSCVDVCGSALPLDCESDDSTAACRCDAPISPYSCADAETLLVCGDDACTPHDCATLCAADPVRPQSLGCIESACECTAVGSACAADDRPRCDGLFVLLSCEAELWVATDCRAVDCVPPQDVAGCVLTAEGTAGCGCFS
jgi:hypothetical protein